MSSPHPRRIVYLALSIAVFFWGAGFAVAKYALRSISPLELLAGSSLFCAVTQFAWTALRGRLPSLRVPASVFWPVLVLAVLGQNVWAGLTYLGLSYTTATNAALLYGFSPVLIAILAATFLGEFLTLRKIGGACVGFFGVALIITGGHLSSIQIRGTFLGNLIVFAATLSWATYSVVTRWITQRLSSNTYTFYILTVGALAPVAWVWAKEARFPLAGLDTITLLAVAFMGIGTGTLAINLWNWGLEKIEASSVAVFSYLEPVFAAVVALVLLGERLALAGYFGGALVFAGIFLSTSERHPSRKT